MIYSVQYCIVQALYAMCTYNDFQSTISIKYCIRCVLKHMCEFVINASNLINNESTSDLQRILFCSTNTIATVVQHSQP
ncbi:hypothetical protein BCR42DRAFT_401675 [Absidia repens]|uniref:Uncharacterized protein n=1 Tax=Absidia repens TaxID=90262 RepID=A0A1X2J2Q8_9FUNG|nr:hypothetical protein BCR42DRAFT_401675 [Absidia repens]